MCVCLHVSLCLCIEEQCKNLENDMMPGNSKEAYNTLKALTKTQQHKSAVIEGGSGNIKQKVQLVEPLD